MTSKVFKYYGHLPMVLAVFGSHPTRALYDTGANGIIIPKVLAEKIIESNEGKMLLDQMSILTGNGYIFAKK